MTPDGRIVLQDFDLASLTFEGSPRTIAEGVASTGGTAMYTASDNGSIAYLSGSSGSDRLVLVDRDGHARTLFTVGGRARVQVPRFSPSGDRIAFVVNDGTEWRGDAWVYSFDSRTAQRLSFEGPSSDPAWTPDGKRIGYSTIIDGDSTASLLSRASDGTGPAEPILSGARDLWQMSFIPASREIIYFAGGRLYRAVPGGEAEPELLLDADFFVTDPAVSPDGRWIAYTSNETGVQRVYVRSYPELGPPEVVAPEQASSPAWSGDGSQIFYWAAGGAPGGRIVAASVRVDGSRISVVDREPLFRFGPHRGHYSRNFGVHPSGEKFVMVGGTGGRLV